MKLRNDILFFLILILPIIPLLFEYSDHSPPPLKGAFREVDSMVLSKDNWIEKKWQENQEEILKSNLKIRPTLIRIQHEMDHRLFQEYHMKDMILGNRGFMFSRNWASARCCDKHLDYDSLTHFVHKLKRLSDLAISQGKYFKVIIAPSKEEIYSDLLPSKFRSENGHSDYNNYIRLLEKSGVDYWDLLSEYRHIIDTSQYPVYSKTSVHWTNYGAHFTTKRILNDMEGFFKKPLNKLGIEKIRLGLFEGSDGDFEQTLNLFSRIDQSEFAYPKYVTLKAENAFKPKVISLADSYYWAMNACWRFPEIYSQESKFFYYYSKSYPNSDDSFTRVKDLNVVEEFINCDAIILLNSSHNLDGFPFGFERDIDKIIEAFEKRDLSE